MKLPNWFRISWWALLTAASGVVLYERYSELFSTRVTTIDVLLFVFWIGLVLAPLFQEISLPGIKLKQEIESLKSAVTAQIGEIRSELKNAIDVRTIFNPQITFPAPVPDARLPELETTIKAAVSEALAARGSREQPAGVSTSAPDDVNFLFATRYNIEKELRRVAQRRELLGNRRFANALTVTRTLKESGLIEPRLEHAIREVYAVCSPAIHGEPVTSAQIKFVRDVGPELIRALRAIE